MISCKSYQRAGVRLLLLCLLSLTWISISAPHWLLAAWISDKSLHFVCQVSFCLLENRKSWNWRQKLGSNILYPEYSCFNSIRFNSDESRTDRLPCQWPMSITTYPKNKISFKERCVCLDQVRIRLQISSCDTQRAVWPQKGGLRGIGNATVWSTSTFRLYVFESHFLLHVDFLLTVGFKVFAGRVALGGL